MRRAIACISFVCTSLIVAQAFADYAVGDVPNPRVQNKWVSDEAFILDAADEAELNAAIDQIHAEQGVEIAVVTVPDVDSATPKDFATELFNHWGIGDAQSHNGLLVLMVVDQRRLEMETGYGTEAVLTDGWLKSMQEAEMVPHFRDGNYGAGVKAGVGASIDRLRQYPDGIPEGSTISSAYDEPFEAEDVPWWILVFGPLLGAGGGAAWWKHRRDRTCPHCKTRMQMLPEHIDDDKLNDAEQLEEALGSVDYQFWYCVDDEFNRMLKINKWFSGHTTCRRCDYRTMTVSSHTVRSPTYSSTGLEEITEDCKNCSYHSTRHRTLPRKTRSTSSSSSSFSGGSSGSSFGGGSSGGGGAGSSW